MCCYAKSAVLIALVNVALWARRFFPGTPFAVVPPPCAEPARQA